MSYVPRPLGHVGLAFMSGVEALFATPGPAGRGQDADGLRVLWYEAADVMSMNATV